MALQRSIPDCGPLTTKHSIPCAPSPASHEPRTPFPSFLPELISGPLPALGLHLPPPCCAPALRCSSWHQFRSILSTSSCLPPRGRPGPSNSPQQCPQPQDTPAPPPSFPMATHCSPSSLTQSHFPDGPCAQAPPGQKPPALPAVGQPPAPPRTAGARVESLLPLTAPSTSAASRPPSQNLDTLARVLRSFFAPAFMWGLLEEISHLCRSQFYKSRGSQPALIPAHQSLTCPSPVPTALLQSLPLPSSSTTTPSSADTVQDSVSPAGLSLCTPHSHLALRPSQPGCPLHQ